jgi:hypothetical protein
MMTGADIAAELDRTAGGLGLFNNRRRNGRHQPNGTIARHERGPSMRHLTVPERHQLKIARDTLKMSDVGARIMGGPDKAEAKRIIARLTDK